MMSFEGRYVVVTGCGQGIGKAIAKDFIDQKAAGVAMLDYNFEQVKEAAAELDPTGKVALPLACDVSKKDQVHTAFEKAYAEFGRIDILVNNAGINRDGMFHKMSEDMMRVVMEVNFFGTYYCCAEVIQKMRDQEYGRIINISSVSMHGNVGQANYAASKGAVSSFTKTLALESARKGITVNAIEPGGIDTAMLRTIPAEKLAASEKARPMQRFGSCAELAKVVLFLASDEASYVSGESIIVAGAGKVI